MLRQRPVAAFQAATRIALPTSMAQTRAIVTRRAVAVTRQRRAPNPALQAAALIRAGSASPLPAGLVPACGARAHGGHGHAHQPSQRDSGDDEGHDQVFPPPELIEGRAVPRVDGGAGQAMHVTYLGLGKNVVLVISKGVVGVTANSAALVADAVHSLSDIVSDLVALATLKVSRRPPSSAHPYGHGKFESIGALCVSGLLVSAGGGLAWHAVELCQHLDAMPVPGAAALWISLAVRPRPPRDARAPDCPRPPPSPTRPRPPTVARLAPHPSAP